MSAPTAIDLETLLVAPGNLAPAPVCGSSADEGGQSVFGVGTTQFDGLPQTVRESELLIGANIAYDFGVLAAHGVVSLEDIFRAYDEERVYDVLIAQALDAIATGHLFKDPRNGGTLRDPTTGKASRRYSLNICTDLTLGRTDAKANDTYRLRYGLLAGLPVAEWPKEALQYPKDDARNTFDVAVAHLNGHDGEVTRKNLHNIHAQVRAAWALHLASMWGFRTDRKRVEALAARVDADHAKMLDSFKPLGFLRPDDSEDTAVVKKAVAKAYGATGPCRRCNGSGKVPSKSKSASAKSMINCKAGVAEQVFRVKLVHPESDTSEVLAQPVFDTREEAGAWIVVQGEVDHGLGWYEPVLEIQSGCDGTGLDLNTAPGLVRTPSGGISASRDTLTESGDETLMAYGAVSESEKVRGTYLPFLRGGLDWPINPRPNVLVESGRTSYSDPTQTFPRNGGLRECIVPRGPEWEIVEVPDDYVLQAGEEWV